MVICVEKNECFLLFEKLKLLEKVGKYDYKNVEVCGNGFVYMVVNVLL